METLWNGIHGMEFRGMKLMEWNFMERNSWNGISWNGNRIDGTFFRNLVKCIYFSRKVLNMLSFHR